MPHCYHAERLAIKYDHNRIYFGPECCIEDAHKWQQALTDQMSVALPPTLDEFIAQANYYLNTYVKLADCLSCDCPYAETVDYDCHDFRFVKVDIDGSCNFNCRHCCVDPLTRIYDPKRRQAQLLCQDWCRQHADTVHLTTRGEPFVSGANGYTAHWLRSLTATDRLKTVNALSNYSLLTPELLDELCGHLHSQGKKLYVLASCDAFEEEHYRQIRRGGNFQQVVRNMKYASERGILHSINYVFMPWNEDITDTIGEQLLALGFDPQRLSICLIPYHAPDFNYRSTIFDAQGNIINSHFRNGQESLRRCGFSFIVNTIGKKKE